MIPDNNPTQWLCNAIGLDSQGARPKFTKFDPQKVQHTPGKSVNDDNIADESAEPIHASNTGYSQEVCVNEYTNLRLDDRSRGEKVQAASEVSDRSLNVLSQRDLDFRDIRARLRTFPQNWSYKISRKELAKYGFIWAGKIDRVKCFHCEGTKENWTSDQTPMGEHKKLFPNCEFIKSVLDEIWESKTQLPRNSRFRRNATRKQNSQNAVSQAVKTAEDLGYSTDVCNNAVENLKRRGKAVTSESVLDELFNTIGLPDQDNSGDKSSVPNSNLEESSRLAQNTNCSLESDSTNCNTATSFRNSQTSNTLQTASAIKDKPRKNISGDIETDCAVESSKDAKDNETEVFNKMKSDSEQWKSRVTCKVCLDSEVGVLFLPCRHLICCNDCASSVSRCPLCRAQIVATIKAYL